MEACNDQFHDWKQWYQFLGAQPAQIRGMVSIRAIEDRFNFMIRKIGLIWRMVGEVGGAEEIFIEVETSVRFLNSFASRSSPSMPLRQSGSRKVSRSCISSNERKMVNRGSSCKFF